jgi:pyruvate/2-oxoglutarate dehydrogenase complex dihydrolipoamide acyltransferase (E2) component
MTRLVELRLPEMDVADARLTVSSWYFAAGQPVVEGDHVMEVLAGDVAIDLAAPASGVLAERCVRVDEPLVAGQLLARIRCREWDD